MSTNAETKAAKGDMTDDELDGLTEEERLGLLEDDDDEAGDDPAAAALEALKAGNDDPDGEDEGDGKGDGKGDDDPAADKGDDAAKAEEDKPARREEVPLLSAEVPANANTRLKEIEDAKDALAQKFDDGELSAKEHMAQLRELDKEADGIKQAIFKADISKEMQAKEVERNWMSDVDRFLAEHPEISKNELVYNAFDAVVRKVTGDDANSKLSNLGFLTKAYGIWADQLGIKAAKADPETKEPGKKADEPAKKGRNIPPTLGRGVPASDISSVDDGKYAALDRLRDADPIAFENALSRMTDDQIAEYERAL